MRTPRSRILVQTLLRFISPEDKAVWLQASHARQPREPRHVEIRPDFIHDGPDGYSNMPFLFCGPIIVKVVLKPETVLLTVGVRGHLGVSEDNGDATTRGDSQFSFLVYINERS